MARAGRSGDSAGHDADHAGRHARAECRGDERRPGEFGEIAENAEYDDAKNEQAMLEHKIAQLEERLLKPDTGNGFILDGYPRNLVQANALAALLKKLGQPIDIAVQLDVDTELLVERLAGRAKAEGRADDSPESVRKRLGVYESQTAPVVDYYRSLGKLAHLNGVGTLDEVFTRITKALAGRAEVG